MNTVKPRSPIRRVSKGRAAQLKEYAVRRKAFLAAHPVCMVWLAENGWVAFGTFSYERDGEIRNNNDLFLGAGAPRSRDIHHKNGRTDWRLNDESHWMAVSREAHTWIHAHPSEARKRGYLI